MFVLAAFERASKGVITTAAREEKLRRPARYKPLRINGMLSNDILWCGGIPIAAGFAQRCIAPCLTNCVMHQHPLRMPAAFQIYQHENLARSSPPSTGVFAGEAAKQLSPDYMAADGFTRGMPAACTECSKWFVTD